MEKKKKNPKKRLKKRNILIFLLFVILIVFTFLNISKIKVKNIYISGNEIYKDSEILKISKLDSYPSFFTVSSFIVENRLKKEPLIKNVTLSKSFWAVININIEENKTYFIYNDELMIEGGKKIKLSNISQNITAPILINEIGNKLFEKLVNAFEEIDIEIIKKISEIEYKPSTLDNERFLFLMNDQNYAYVTIVNMKNVNLYSKIVPQLEGKRGIINFDSFRESDIGVTIDILE